MGEEGIIGCKEETVFFQYCDGHLWINQTNLQHFQLT